ncbi:dihydroorotase [Aestuariivirga litoralis]|uniref:dihydroorotase n=1 Tax=Aestuariivirga litoralis TaxID=2650924 RepID=UPI0018C6189E|nr:dihydroorotase [Aestuariivirga litoralis]MBG1231605.1 amidohydrolase family protein [Aestuariivirga litoralis]
MKRAYLNAKLAGGNGGLLIENGLVVAAGADVTKDNVPGAQMVDCGGKLLLPGLIDMRVFTGEPGTEYRETLATASDAAAAGGVTTMIVMPNTDPVIDDAAMVDFILRRARDTAKVRVAPMCAITKGLKGEAMTELGLMKAAGAVAATDGIKSVTNAALLRRTMTYAKDHGMLIVQHVEEPGLASGVMNAGEAASRLGLAGSHAMAEVMMLERDLRLVEMTGASYHVAQISCAESAEVMRRAKAKGLAVSCGVSINHLVLNENDIGAYRTFFKLSPPLRCENDRRALVEALREGVIDVVVSGHDPQSDDTKRLPFAEAAFGAIGLDTLMAGLLSLYHNENISLSRIIEAGCEAPARVLGLPQGKLVPGAPADFCLVDPQASWKVQPESLFSRSKNSPFEHRTIEGRVMETVVAGQTVYSAA